MQWWHSRLANAKDSVGGFFLTETQNVRLFGRQGFLIGQKKKKKDKDQRHNLELR